MPNCKQEYVWYINWCEYSNFSGAGDVWFSLNGTTYHNNSKVTLEDIGDGEDGLLCRTNLTACCQRPYTGDNGSAIGNWFFPNGSIVRSSSASWDFHRTRGQMEVVLHRIRGGEEGIYRCEIHDSKNINQTIYIGVYSAASGEWHCLYTPVVLNFTAYMCCRRVRFTLSHST